MTIIIHVNHTDNMLSYVSPEGNFSSGPIEERMYRVYCNFDLDNESLNLTKCNSSIPGINSYSGILTRNDIISVLDQDEILREAKNYLADNIIKSGPKTPSIMGIVNMTPDSFYEDSRYSNNLKKIMDIAKFSDIIDIGGESTRPGAVPVRSEIEFERIKPALDLLTVDRKYRISIDTRNPLTLEKSLSYGIEYANDVSGFSTRDMINIARDNGLKCIVMHMRGNPNNMMKMASYTNVTEEVKYFLVDRARTLMSEGIKVDNIILDPGIGFAKDADQNVTLLRGIRELNVGFKVMVGHSRKSFLGKIIGDSDTDRLSMTLAVSNYLALNGADIIRVHDPVENRNSVRTFLSLLNGWNGF